MPDFVIKIEQACLQLHWPFLFVPGLLATLLGLFLWLGGLRYAGAVIGIVGALLGAAAGIALSPMVDWHPLITIAAASAILCLIAVLMRQTVIFLLAALIFAALCGITYMSYAMSTPAWKDKIAAISDLSENPDDSTQENSAYWNLINKLAAAHAADEQTDENDSESLHESALATFKAILAEIQLSAQTNKTTLIVWIILGSLAGLCAAFVLKKIIMALCCSIVGTTSVMLGTIALLFAKKTEVFTSLTQRPKVLPVIFLTMIAFGFITQLLFAPRETPREEQENKE